MQNPQPNGPANDFKLSVSRYDQVSSTLMTFVLTVGVFVAAMLVIFFSGRVFPPKKSVPVTLNQVGGRPPEAAFGFGRDLDPPGLPDAPEISDPQLQRTLNALSDVASTQAAALDSATIGTDLISSRGTGVGDSRGLGPVGEGISEKVPRPERWEIRFAGGELSRYARQLDYFGVELAVLDGDANLVHYAYHLSQPRPDQRTQSPESESRLYMTWRAGPLQAADRELLTRAGIPSQGRIILQVYPRETEDQLALVELQHAKGKTVNDIRKTVFGVRPQGDGYEFYVVDQRYF